MSLVGGDPSLVCLALSAAPVSAVGRCGKACLARGWEPRSACSSSSVSLISRHVNYSPPTVAAARPSPPMIHTQLNMGSRGSVAWPPGPGQGACACGVCAAQGGFWTPGVGEARKQAGVGQNAVWALGRGSHRGPGSEGMTQVSHCRRLGASDGGGGWGPAWPAG